MATKPSFEVLLSDEVSDGMSRARGANARRALTELLARHGSISVSLEGVELTPSFADECFGRLLLELGEERFRGSLRIHGGSQAVRRLVNQVLRSRLAELRGAPPRFGKQ